MLHHQGKIQDEAVHRLHISVELLRCVVVTCDQWSSCPDCQKKDTDELTMDRISTSTEKTADLAPPVSTLSSEYVEGHAKLSMELESYDIESADSAWPCLDPGL